MPHLSPNQFVAQLEKLFDQSQRDGHGSVRVTFKQFLRKVKDSADREPVCLVRAHIGDNKHKNKQKLSCHVAAKDLPNFQKKYNQCLKDKTYALMGRGEKRRMDEEHKKQGIPVGKRLGLRTKNPRRRKRKLAGMQDDDDDQPSPDEEPVAAAAVEQAAAKRRKQQIG